MKKLYFLHTLRALHAWRSWRVRRSAVECKANVTAKPLVPTSAPDWRDGSGCSGQEPNLERGNGLREDPDKTGGE